MIQLTEKSCLIILISESCLRSGEFSVEWILILKLDRYNAEISHCEQFCDSGLAFVQYKHRQNSFVILALWHLILLQRLHHRLMSCIFCVHGDLCTGNHFLKQRVFLYMNKKHLSDVGLLLQVMVTEMCCTHQCHHLQVFMFIFKIH